MDDLYGNAWGDSSDIAGDIHLSHSTTWTTPKLPTHNEEADLAAPSWSTGAGIQWNEPSQGDHEFKWSANDPDLAWTADTTFSIRSSIEPEVVHTPPVPDSQNLEEHQDEVEDEGTSTEAVEPVDDSPPLSSATVPGVPFVAELEASLQPPLSSPPLSRSPSPDGFGTFESGFATSAEAVTGALSPAIVEEEDWGSPWAGTERPEETDDSQPVDDWEAARQQKEQLDKRIPPEVLANILAESAEFFQDSKEISATSEEEKADESWMNRWRDGLDSIDGLEALIRTIVPDLTLQPAPQFTKTAIAKSMASSVRLSKNLPLAKSSPLSLYFATKGSTAWENAVKERKVAIEEDVVPAGWRILEKTQTETPDLAKSAKQGGFFSFWGRRHSKAPSMSADSSTQSLASPTRSSSVPPVDPDSASKRTSHEISNVIASSSKESIVLAAPTSEVKTAASPAMELPTPPPTSLYADAPDLTTDKGDMPPPAQAPPSAVSRFLNRFSRTRSSLGSPSPRNSFALSSDDLDVLSDIVPSVHDGFDDDGDVGPTQSLATVLKAEPLPPILPPPPIAPPLQARMPSTTGSTALIDSSSSTMTESKPAATASNDLDDLFGAFETVTTSSQTSAPASTFDDFTAFSSAPLDTEAAAAVIPSIQPARTASPASFSVLEPSSPMSRLSPQQTSTNPSTPISRPGSALSSQSKAPFNGTNGVSTSRILQPKLPLSLSLPPPPSSPHVSPPLSASEVPLAKLYPNAVGKGIPHHAGPSANGSRSSSPFAVDKVPVKRNTTPIMVDRPSKAPVAAPLLPPPPSFVSQAASSSTAVETQNLFDDDDDFADFQSPVEPISETLLPSQPSQQFSFPAPPPSGPRGVSTATSTPAPVTAAPFPKAAQPSTPPTVSKPLGSDLSAFFSSSSSSYLHPHSSRSSGFDSSFASASDKSFFSNHNDTSDFDDFVETPSSSALRTPSPPRPIEKSPKPSLSIKPLPSSSTSRMSDETRNRQHQHTLSLMELAAARPGRWPAPPSPLPQALAFPGSTSKGVDLMEDDEGFGDVSDSPTVPPKNDFLLPPPTRATPPVPVNTAPLFSFEADNKSVPPLSLPPAPAVKKQENKGNGGLSAQDLSFFEGL